MQTILQSAAAGFAFGEAALFAVEPILTQDGVLLTAATAAAERTGSTGVGAVVGCLVFTSALISLGSGFLLAAVVMKFWDKVGVRIPWLEEATFGASVVVGATSIGVLGGILPPWIYIAAQGILVLIVYSYSSINDMTTALIIISSTLHLSILCGRMGAIVGLLVMCMTISVFFGLRNALTKKTPRPKPGCRLLERISFYSVFVGIMGFSVGLGAGEGEIPEADMILMLQSILWVAFLSAGLLGAGLSAVAMVGLGPNVAGKVAAGVAIFSSVALRVIVNHSSSLGARGSMGGMLGATTAAGVSLGAASVAAKQAFQSRDSALVALASVVVGAVVPMRGATLHATLPTTSELITVTLVAIGAFILGAPKSPFHTQVNLQRGLVTGPQLIIRIGMETITAAAAPIGAGALGAAALGTAALGILGTVGVLVALVLAFGSVLSGMIGKAHRE